MQQIAGKTSRGSSSWANKLRILLSVGSIAAGAALVAVVSPAHIVTAQLGGDLQCSKTELAPTTCSPR